MFNIFLYIIIMLYGIIYTYNLLRAASRELAQH